ncbi:MAG: hypothetical protein GXO92_02350 [FCB group bacterium]|nr:hypothetical protein [FCB group bacterium]
MLYRLVKLVAVIGIKIFYNRIIVKNVHYVPKKGPVIFAANHPSTMMDGFILGYACPRDLHFLAKSTIFRTRFHRWILSRLRLIPVYRKQDQPEAMGRNRETFACCYELLEEGKAFLIFPEGTSTGERVLSKIKTGAARIGFGAEKRNDFQLNVQIIPVGLNYSNVIKFRSDVYVRYGHPIFLKDYQEDFKADKVAAVKKVTDQIETALSKLTVTVKELEMEQMVTALEDIYKKELIVDLGLQVKDQNDEFSVSKGLINAVEWFYENQPERVEKFKEILSRYQNNLERLHLRDEFFSPVKGSSDKIKSFQAVLFLVTGFPIYLYGLINNYIPYKIPRWYAAHFLSAKSQWASTKMIVGAVSFLVYYGVGVSVVMYLTDNPLIVILYILSLIPSGNFVLKYVRKAKEYRQHMRFMSVFYHKRILVYKIIQQRMQIVQLLNKAKTEYMRAVGLRKPKPKQSSS